MKLKLEDVIRLNNGLNILANNNVAFKNVELSFDIAMYKKESEKLLSAFQEVMKSFEGTSEEKEKEGKTLLEKEYELDVPIIKLSDLKESKVEIPLVAFEFLRDFITKDKK